MNRLFSFRQVALAVAAPTILGLGLPASAAAPVPFRGRGDVVITGAEPVPPASRRLTASATGRATHLGRFTRTETVVLNLENLTLTGTLVFTAANGDQLNANVTGGFTSPTTAVGTYTFTGGTGRFQNASGQAAFEVVAADASGINFDVTFGGTIQY